MLAGGAGGKKNAHASTLAMQLLVFLAAHPPLSSRLREAGGIPAVVACLEDQAALAMATAIGNGRASEGGGGVGGSLTSTAASADTRALLMRSSLKVLASFLRGASNDAEGEKKTSSLVLARLLWVTLVVQMLEERGSVGRSSVCERLAEMLSGG